MLAFLVGSSSTFVVPHAVPTHVLPRSSVLKMGAEREKFWVEFEVRQSTKLNRSE